MSNEYLKHDYTLTNSTQLSTDLLKARANLNTELTQDTTLTAGVNKDKVDFGIFTQDEGAIWNINGQYNPFSNKGSVQAGYTQSNFDINGKLNTNGRLQASLGVNTGSDSRLSLTGSVFGGRDPQLGVNYTSHNRHNKTAFSLGGYVSPEEAGFNMKYTF